MTKTRIKMNKPLYLGMLILGITKILMYDFWYDYISPVFGSNSKGFKEFKSGISFSLKSLSSVLFSFSMFFLSFSVLFHFYLPLLIKRILLS